MQLGRFVIDKETRAILEHTLPDTQHLTVDVLHGERGGYCIMRKARHTNDPIAYYAAQGWLTKENQYTANRLRNDCYIAGIYAPKGFELREKIDASPSSGLSNRQVEARTRYRNALLAIADKTWQRAVSDVACYGHWLNELNYIPKRNATSNLAVALEQVSKFYIDLKRGLT